jgi:iron complex outermembrane receptor protein
MRGYGYFLLYLLGTPALSAQTDTVALQPVQVVDYTIKANQSTKQQIINLDSLAQLGRFNLGQVLQIQTPAFVKTYGGNGIATLSLRGSGANHTRVFWNNLDISSPSLGLADLSTLPALAFDAAQLQYGSASLSDGSGALGGSLRLQSLTHTPEKFKANVSQLYGSFGQWQSAASVAGHYGRLHYKTKAYYFSAQNNFEFIDITQPEQPDRILQNNTFKQKGVLQEFSYRLKANQRLSLKAWYNQTDRQLPPPITGNPENYDSLQDAQLSAVAEYQLKTARGAWLLNSGWVNSKNNFYQFGTSSLANNQYQSWQNNLRFKQNFGVGWQIEAGLRYRLDAVNSDGFNQIEKRQTSAAFANLQIPIAKGWQGEVLLRQEHIHDFLSPLMGSAGVVYALANAHRLKANLARNFRYPTLNDWYWQPGGNPELLPEQSWQAEAGYAYQTGNQKAKRFFGLEATLFHALIDNWIQWVPFENYTRPQNLRKVQNTGIELSQNAHYFWKGVKISGQLQYSYVRSKTLEVYGLGQKAQQLAYVPFQRGNAALGLTFKGWQVLYNQSFTDRYFTTASNNVYMPAYTVAQISLRKKNILPLKKQALSACLSIFNLGNYPYQILPYRPEPGIHFNLQINYSFAP